MNVKYFPCACTSPPETLLQPTRQCTALEGEDNSDLSNFPRVDALGPDSTCIWWLNGSAMTFFVGAHGNGEGGGVRTLPRIPRES